MVCALAVLVLTAVTAFAQSASSQDSKVTGGPFAGGLGMFNFDHSTSDLGLSMGGAVQIGMTETTAFSTSAAFLANVDDNDAFDDRSAMFTAGLEYRLKNRQMDPFLAGGYALAHGEIATHHFGYFGGGVRKWYAERVGWQLEARDYLSGDTNMIEIRFGILLR